MKATLMSFLFLLLSCAEQNKSKFSERIAEIEKLRYFDNWVVIGDENQPTNNDAMLTFWTPEAEFYPDDMVTYKHGISYVALKHNKGRNPATSPEEWAKIFGPHPFLFLRDSASLDELTPLAESNNVYVRLYGFAALSNRKADGLFELLRESLNDSTTVHYQTGDVGYCGYPIDLMIEWELKNLDTKQREELILLISEKYPHLRRAKEMLIQNEICCWRIDTVSCD